MKKVKVTLALPHTHAGTDLKPGAVIEVTEDQRARLVRLGVVAADTKAPVDPAAEPATEVKAA